MTRLLRKVSVLGQLALFAVLSLALSCEDADSDAGKSSQDGDKSGKTDDLGQSPPPAGLGIPVPADPFSFDIAKNGLELKNARWLAWFARNEYSDFEFLGPALEKLGFGDPGEGSGWAAKAKKLRQLKAENPTEAAHYENELVHTVHPGAKIEFFSGGQLHISSASGGSPVCNAQKQCDLDGDGDVGAADATFKLGSTQVVWARHRTLPLVIVAFRGTEVGKDLAKIKDVITDLNVFEVSIEGWGQVHGGFDAAMDSIKNKLLVEKLKEIQGTQTALYVTGHSLGAALATLFTSRVLDFMADEGHQYNLRGLYTFGSPRVGDKAYAKRFESLAAKYKVSVMRFRHADDVVTRIPEDLMPIGGVFDFKHVGQMVFLRYDGNLWFKPEQTEDITWRTHPAKSGVDDHSMDSYYARILAHGKDAALSNEVAGWENCGNGIDDNDNGTVDCSDATCAGLFGCPGVATVCQGQVASMPKADILCDKAATTEVFDGLETCVKSGGGQACFYRNYGSESEEPICGQDSGGGYGCSLSAFFGCLCYGGGAGCFDKSCKVI